MIFLQKKCLCILSFTVVYCILPNHAGAKWARDVVFSVLSTACDDGDLTIAEAIEAVEDIFRNNALRLYKLNGIVGSINNSCTKSFENTLKSNISIKDTVFVRVIWVDASGQHRCRVSIFYCSFTMSCILCSSSIHYSFMLNIKIHHSLTA